MGSSKNSYQELASLKDMGMSLDLIKKAMMIRQVETRLLELFSKGKLNGTVHTCVGQEISALAFAGQLQDGDIVFSNHRCHGHFLAFTQDVKGLLAELMGFEGGVCAGVGGSQHLYKDGFFSNGIQGGIVPVAAGLALAQKLNKSQGVTVVFIGDGTLGEGVVYETMNIAAKWELPLLIVCENNFYAQSTSQERTLSGSICQRAQAFGIQTQQGHIWDPKSLMAKAQEAIDFVRQNKKPLFYQVDSYRLNPHSKGDDNRDSLEISRYRELDPLNIFLKQKPAQYQQLLDEVNFSVEQAEKEIEKQGELSVGDYCKADSDGDCGEWEILEQGFSKKQVELINHFFKVAMKENEKIIFMGEDVLSPYGGAFKVSRDLSDLFPGRVLTTPISEAAIVGMGNGLALAGFKPFVEIMFGDFVTLAMDQLLNHASKFTHMYNHQVSCPLAVRLPMGGRRGYGPTHSQSLDRLLLGMPQVKVAALNTLIDPQLIYKNVLKDQNPVVVIENKTDYGRVVGPVAVTGYAYEYTVAGYPWVRLCPVQAKASVTIVCYGGMSHIVIECLQEIFVQLEIWADVLIPSLISAGNLDPILESVKLTGRLCVVEEGVSFAGWASEIITQVLENSRQPVLVSRAGALAVPIPAVKSLEKECLPDVKDIIEAIAKLF